MSILGGIEIGKGEVHMVMSFKAFARAYREAAAAINWRPRESTIRKEYKGFKVITRITGVDNDIIAFRTPSGRPETIASPRYES